MRQVQHTGFGKEIRALICSKKTEDKELAGIIVSELKALKEHKEAGRNHPAESALHGGDLTRIRELVLYLKGNSARVYFTVKGDEIIMLGIFANKRRTKLDKEMERRLLERLAEGPTRSRTP